MHKCVNYKALSLENFFFSENLEKQNLPKDIFPTGKIFPDNKKQMLLAKALWICDFHRLQQFWTFCQGVPEPQHSDSRSFPPLCSSTSRFAGAFTFQELLFLSLINFWFHTFFRFTLGSCFHYSLFTLFSRGASPESHHQSLLSLVFNRYLPWKSPIRLPETLKLGGDIHLPGFGGEGCAMEVSIFTDYKKYLRSRSDVNI